MLRYEASVRELFYRSCTVGRSFVPQDDGGNDRAMLQISLSSGGKLTHIAWRRRLTPTRLRPSAPLSDCVA